MSYVIGFLIGIGCLLISIWNGYRLVYIKKAYRSLTAKDEYSSFSVTADETTTISGELIVDEIAPESEHLVDPEYRPGFIVWRIRRGKQSELDKRLGSKGDWSTNESGIIAGEIRIDDGNRKVRIDPNWIVTRHQNKNIESLTESDLKGRGPRSSQAWESPYIYLNEYHQSYQLNEDTMLPPEVRSRLGGELDRYQLEVKFLPAGKEVTAHGSIEVEEGVPILRGSSHTPMVISDRNVAELDEYLRSRALKSGMYALVLFVVASVLLVWAGGHVLTEAGFIR